MPPKELFSFESADFLQIGKPVCVTPEVDVSRSILSVRIYSRINSFKAS